MISGKLTERGREVARIVDQLRRWSTLSARPYSNEAAMRSCELRIAWSLIEAVRVQA